jgi:hypothetical protein
MYKNKQALSKRKALKANMPKKARTIYPKTVTLIIGLMVVAVFAMWLLVVNGRQTSVVTHSAQQTVPQSPELKSASSELDAEAMEVEEALDTAEIDQAITAIQ